jgi:hypothetical protein
MRAVAAVRSLQQRVQREDHELGISRRVGRQSWFVNCWGGGAEALGAVSAALMAADAAADAERSASVPASHATSGKSRPDVGQ